MDSFMWGDEVEYGIFSPDTASGRLDLSCPTGYQVQERLTHGVVQKNGPGPDVSEDCEWHPEYGSWMVEAVPGKPFGSSNLHDVLQVQQSMQVRRSTLHQALSNGQIAPSLSCFPMLGVIGYQHVPLEGSTESNEANPISQSDLVSDAAINPHPRFATLTQNIRQRRGSKVDIRIPIDSHPDDPAPASPSFACKTRAAGTEVTTTALTTGVPAIAEESIHLDAMAFGMGCCCLQLTMQTHNEAQSRYLHDQLAVLSPLLHALSASTPIVHGRLVGTDTRWDIIKQAVDDRTPAERRDSSDSAVDTEQCRDGALAGGGVRLLPQSRYSEVPLYLSRPHSAEDKAALDALNDVEVPIDEGSYARLREGGVDETLARHVAHLFVRDPLVVFPEPTDNGPSLVSSTSQCLLQHHTICREIM
jgi:glutamate--cysteine ligase catalytic subunit